MFRVFVSRFLALVLIANLFGMSAAAYAESADLHIDEAQVATFEGPVPLTGNDGAGSSDCAHACHLALHFLGQICAALIFLRPLTDSCPSAAPCSGAAFFSESPFRPPRTLV